MIICCPHCKEPIRFTVSNPEDKMPLADLDFSVRARHLFASLGALTLGDLKNVTMREICDVKGIGCTTAGEIRDVLRQYYRREDVDARSIVNHRY